MILFDLRVRSGESPTVKPSCGNQPSRVASLLHFQAVSIDCLLAVLHERVMVRDSLPVGVSY